MTFLTLRASFLKFLPLRDSFLTFYRKKISKYKRNRITKEKNLLKSTGKNFKTLFWRGSFLWRGSLYGVPGIGTDYLNIKATIAHVIFIFFNLIFWVLNFVPMGWVSPIWRLTDPPPPSSATIVNRCAMETALETYVKKLPRRVRNVKKLPRRVRNVKELP